MSGILERFARLVGDKYAIRDQAAMAPHLTEPRELYRGRAALVLKPGSTEEVAAQSASDITARLRTQLYLPAMPIQDAIDLAHFLVDTAARFAHFSLRAATATSAYSR